MNRTSYIITLPIEVQNEILNGIKALHDDSQVNEYDLELIMNSRLCDLDYLLNIDKYLYM